MAGPGDDELELGPKTGAGADVAGNGGCLGGVQHGFRLLGRNLPTTVIPRNGWKWGVTSPKIGEVEARFDDLQVFEAIRRTGSLSAAARELRRSPNGVTRSLTRLEASLGVRLFHRTTRSLALTDELSAELDANRPTRRCRHSLY